MLGFGSGMAVGGALIVAMELWPVGICLLFGVTGGAERDLVCLALRIYGLSALVAGINILICNYCQACEQEKGSFVLETLRGAAVLLPMTLIFSRLGLQGFWWLFPATELLSLAIFALTALGGRYTAARIDPGRVFQRTIPSTAEDVGAVSQELETFCQTWNAQARQQYFVTMAAEELCLAILHHGFGGRADGYIQITVIALEDGEFELHLRDDAVTFDPFSLETGRAGSGESFDVGSLGVLVVKKQAKSFFYRRYQGFNTLIVRI